MNTYTDPKALKAGEVPVAVNADFSRGVTTGYWGPGTSVKTTEANCNFAYYLPGHDWLYSKGKMADGRTNWACRDAPTASGDSVVYLTQLQDDNTTVNSPIAYLATDDFRLGIPAPTTAPALNTGGVGGTRAYSYTYWDSTHLVESNPYAIAGNVANVSTATITSLPTSVPTNTGVNYIRVYGTNRNTALTGPKFYLGQIAIASGTFNDSNADGDPALPLNWGPGGDPTNSSTALQFDHSPAPLLTCLSDTMHSISLAGGAGVGLLFGAEGSTVRWTLDSGPFYWPTKAFCLLPFPVLALVTRGAHTYAFTEGGVWSFSGASGTSIIPQKVPNALGILRFAGKSVAQTPWGITYLTREGPTLCDGYATRPLTVEVLNPVWNNTTTYCGAYYDGFYYLQIVGDACVALDMRGYPTVSATSLNIASSALVIVPSSAAGPTPGLYAINASDGHIQPFRPMEGSGVTGSTQGAWTVLTGKSDLGLPGKLKRIKQVRAEASGAVVCVFTAYPSGKTFTLTLASGSQTYRLVAGFEGLHFDCQYSAAEGATQLVSMNAIATVFDAA